MPRQLLRQTAVGLLYNLDRSTRPSMIAKLAGHSTTAEMKSYLKRLLRQQWG
jgi:hypothetical protein